MDCDIWMPCVFLVGFQETEIHSRTREGCHMSTFWLGRDKDTIQVEEVHATTTTANKEEKVQEPTPTTRR